MRFLTLGLLLILSSVLFAQKPANLILIRHAEKINDGTPDPSLSQQGEQRADCLKQIFVHQQIDEILSTGYKRTESTVKPLSENKGLEIQLYNPQDPGLQTWMSKYAGKTVVIVGHSNTIPSYVNFLAGTNLTTLDENDYNKIFLISGTEKNITLTVMNMECNTH